MELLSVNIARAIWFIDTADINPRGINLRNTLIPALAEKYKFAKYPTEVNLDPNQEGEDQFLRGTFSTSQGIEIVINFTSYIDGLVAETRSSTHDSEAFLEEFSEWIVKDFGLVFRPSMIRRKGYLTELLVKMDYSLSGLNPELQSFADKLSGLVSLPNEPILFEPSGIGFAPNTNSSLKPAEFIIERAVNAPFSENRYFSRAPLHTDVHIELLAELEKILIS